MTEVAFTFRERARQLAKANRAMCAERACRARRARSSGARTPSGSTSRANLAKNAAVPAAVDVPPRAWSVCAASLARSVRSEGDNKRRPPIVTCRPLVGA